jgi:Tol biopolymer transport system component
MRLRRSALVAVLVSLTVAAPAVATFPGRNGDIAFNRLTQADDLFVVDLFTVSPSGAGNPFQLTDFGFDSFSEYPDYSPDGRTVAFQRYNPVADEVEVWTIGADGTGARQLTDLSIGAFDPAYSPDGRTLAIDTAPGDVPGIHLIPSRAPHGKLIIDAQAKRVTTVTGGGWDSEPQFSPDGKWIVFTRYSVECDGDDVLLCKTRIFKVRTDGTGLRQLTAFEHNASAPDWHPSGLLIAVDTDDSNFAPGNGDIVLMATDGSHKTRIIRGDADSFYNNPSFSPDGLRLTFVHWPFDADGEVATSEVWTAWITGHGQKRLTTGAIRDNKPDWGSKPHGGH